MKSNYFQLYPTWKHDLRSFVDESVLKSPIWQKIAHKVFGETVSNVTLTFVLESSLRAAES